MNPPPPIADFFRMKNEHDDDGLWSLFTDDATVFDGGAGKTTQGADEIKKWIYSCYLLTPSSRKWCHRPDNY